MQIKPKVLFLVTGLDVGGIETYLLRFLKETTNIEATVLCKSGKGGKLVNQYLKIGADVKLLYFGFYNIKSWYRFYSYIKKENFNSICDFTGDFAGIPLAIAWLVNVKNRVVFYRNSEYQFSPSILKLGYAKISSYLTLFFSTKILSNSKTALDNYHPNRSMSNQKFDVIFNGIPTPIINEKKVESIKTKFGITDNNFVVGHVGRFSKAKNHDTIIKVANELCAKYENVIFLLCGKGVESGINELMNNQKLNSRIITPGVCDEIYNWTNCMDTFLFPSLNEGQPNALLEAMVSGIPVVASNISTIKESVPEELNEVLFAPKAVDSFISKIEESINGKIHYDTEKTKNWALERYNLKTNFNMFYKQLKIEK